MATFKNSGNLFLIAVFSVPFAFVFWLFYFGYTLFEPLNLHSWLESLYPEVFEAWRHHDKAKNYAITYTWIYIGSPLFTVISCIMAKFFLLYRKEPLLDDQKIKQMAPNRPLYNLVVSLLATAYIFYISRNGPSNGGRGYTYIFHQTEAFGLSLLLIAYVGSLIGSFLGIAMWRRARELNSIKR